MAVNNVTSSTSAVLQIQQPKVQEKKEPVRQEEQRVQTQESRQEVKQAAKTREPEPAPEPPRRSEPVRPVVNTQGQTTGRLVNTSA